MSLKAFFTIIITGQADPHICITYNLHINVFLDETSVQFTSVLFPSKIQNQTTSKSLKTTNTGWGGCNGRQKPVTCCTPVKEQKQVKTIQDKTRRYKTNAEV